MSDAKRVRFSNEVLYTNTELEAGNTLQTKSAPFSIEVVRAMGYKDVDRREFPWHCEIPMHAIVMTRRPDDDRAARPNNRDPYNSKLPEPVIAATLVHVNYLMRQKFVREVAPLFATCPIEYPYNWNRIIEYCMDDWMIGGVNQTPDIETRHQTSLNPHDDRVMTLFTQFSQQKVYNYWGGYAFGGDYLYFAKVMVPDKHRFRLPDGTVMIGDALPKAGNLLPSVEAVKLLNAAKDEETKEQLFPYREDRHLAGTSGIEPKYVLEAAEVLRFRFGDHPFFTVRDVGDEIAMNVFANGWSIPQIVAVTSSHPIEYVTYRIAGKSYRAPVQLVGRATRTMDNTPHFHTFTKREPSLCSINEHVNAQSNIDANLLFV